MQFIAIYFYFIFIFGIVLIAVNLHVGCKCFKGAQSCVPVATDVCLVWFYLLALNQDQSSPATPLSGLHISESNLSRQSFCFYTGEKEKSWNQLKVLKFDSETKMQLIIVVSCVFICLTVLWCIIFVLTETHQTAHKENRWNKSAIYVYRVIKITIVVVIITALVN